MTEERIKTWLEDHRTEILGLLESLVNVNSYTGNRDGVNEVGDRVATFLAPLGFREQRWLRTAIGDHRSFTREGPGPRILFSCHLDTVFPPELGFNHCILDDEVTRGPGVIDMKGGITVLLAALKMLDDLGMRPAVACEIFFSADEETGSEDARPLIEAAAAGKDYGLVFECGGSHGEVVSARKGVGTFHVEIEGKAAHAGNDFASGVDANLEAAHKLLALNRLCDLSRSTTVNVGQITGGIGANTISPHASLLIEFRFTDRTEGDRVLAGLEAVAAQSFVPGTQARLSGRIQRPVMEESPATAIFAAEVNRLGDGRIQSEKRGGVGDANFIAFAGVPTLDGFGPIGGKDHTPEEFMLTSSLFERIDLLARVLTHLAQQP